MCVSPHAQGCKKLQGSLSLIHGQLVSVNQAPKGRGDLKVGRMGRHHVGGGHRRTGSDGPRLVSCFLRGQRDRLLIK